MSSGPRGRAALALGLGLSALAFPIARLGIVPFVGPNPIGQPAADASLWIIAAQALGAVVLGAVVGLFGRSRAVAVVVIAIYFVGPWLPQIRSFQDVPRPFIFSVEWRSMTPVIYAAVALVALVFGAIAARYFATRTPTIP